MSVQRNMHILHFLGVLSGFTKLTKSLKCLHRRVQVFEMNILKIYSCLLLLYNLIAPRDLFQAKSHVLVINVLNHLKWIYGKVVIIYIVNSAFTRECCLRDSKDIAFTRRPQFRWINIYSSKKHKFAVMLTWDPVFFIIDATCIQLTAKPHLFTTLIRPSKLLIGTLKCVANSEIFPRESRCHKAWSIEGVMRRYMW